MRLLDQIRERGYWQVIIRPQRFNPTLIASRNDLHQILEKSQVRIRGWDFPDLKNILNYQDFIGAENDWDSYRSILRFYQSGQFIYIFSIFDDWRDRSSVYPIKDGWEPCKQLGVGNTVATFSEIFLFASRLSMSFIPNDDQVKIEIKIFNLTDRILEIDMPHRSPFRHPRQTSEKKYVYSSDYKKSDLISNHNELSLLVAKDFFELFMWNHESLDMLREIQQQLKFN
jgi:hypothetical protein